MHCSCRCRPIRCSKSFVPSKLFDFCALGRPVVLAANGEPQRLVDGLRAAVPVPAGDAEALAAAIRRLRDDPAEAATVADAGRRFAVEHLRDRQLDRLEAVLEDVDRARR